MNAHSARGPSAAKAHLRAVNGTEVPESLISIREAARLLGRSWDFVADRKAEFRAVPQGRVYGIPPSAVREWISTQQDTLRRRAERRSNDNLSRMWGTVKRKSA